MIITFTELTGGSTTTDASSIVSSAINVTLNVPVFLFVGNTKAASVDTGTPTDNAAGGTNTYTSIRNKNWNTTAAPTRRMQAWVMIPKATESITITISFGANQTALFHSVVQATGADPVGTVVQSAHASNATSDTSATNANSDVALAAFGNSANGLLYFAGIATNNSITLGGSLANIRGATGSTPNFSFRVGGQIGEDLAPTCSWTGSVQHYELGFEVKAQLSDASLPLMFKTRDV